MKRLTARDRKGNAYFPACFEEPCGGGGCTMDHCAFFDQVCEKLAGYEEAEEERTGGKDLERLEGGKAS